MKVLKKILVGILILLLGIFCCYYIFWRTPDDVVNKNDFVTEIKDVRAFDEYASFPLMNIYGGVKAIKIVYEKSRKKLFFINGQKYNLHYTFCRDVLKCFSSSALFNAINYSQTPLRKYILVNLNYFPSQDVYALEFQSEDQLSASEILEVYQVVNEKLSFQNLKLALFVNNNYLRDIQSELKGVSFIYENDVYDNINYQAIGVGEVYGKIKFVSSKKELNNCSPSDIIVLHGTPVYLPNCQGVISDVFQTPLSHIQVLAKNKNIVSMAYKSIFDSEFRKYDNQFVRLTVTRDTFDIEVVSEAEFGGKQKQTRKEIVLQSDLGNKEIKRIQELSHSDRISIGNKAGGLALLNKLADDDLFSVPEDALAIPFYYYNRHLQSKEIKLLLSDLSTLEGEQLKQKQKQIRRAIKNKTVASKLIENIYSNLIQSKYEKFRFRSSSNAEDGKMFSGAGLYKSKSAVVNKDSIAKAICSVWASAWSMKAYKERAFYGIGNDDFQMGILVHRSFPNEDCNGVIVTKNLYGDALVGFTINVQKGDVSVVEPDENVKCDQMIVFRSPDISSLRNRLAVQYIAIGNQNSGKAVLTKKQYNQLYRAAEKVQKYYNKSLGSESALDIEFKFDSGKLYLKQVRVY